MTLDTPRYNHVFVAGTFDGLHRGHEAVLSRAFAEGQYVTIAITSQTFVERFKPEYAATIRSFDVRKQHIEAWLAEQGRTGSATIISIDDPYEPASSSSQYDALIVTTQNITTGETINARRLQHALPVLALIEVSLIPASDGQPISATRVRNNEIDGAGNLILPEALRPELKHPLGTIIEGTDVPAMLEKHTQDLIITVGDYTTKTVRERGLLPVLAVIDLKVGRQPFMPLEGFAFPPDVSMVYFPSGPGFISIAAEEAITAWKKTPTPTVFVVEGEDDLLVLPVVSAAQEGSVVLYGQPDQGMVEVIVTKAVQERVRALLEQFERN